MVLLKNKDCSTKKCLMKYYLNVNKIVALNTKKYILKKVGDNSTLLGQNISKYNLILS